MVSTGSTDSTGSTGGDDVAGDWVVVGRVGRAHGIRGDVAVDVRTDEPERRFAPGAALRTATGHLTVASSRTHSGRLLVRFEELTDRTEAESARGTELTVAVDPGERPDDPEEFYDHQLVGLHVVTTADEPVGELLRVEHHGAQDLLVIATPRGEVLFPFVTALVPLVDLGAGRLVVDDAPGLLYLE